MKILTFYFSGSGNTKWAAEQFDGILKARGHVSQLLAIDEIDTAEYLRTLPDIFDYIGFAQPIYAADIPRIMHGTIRRFIQAAETLSAVTSKLFFINTYAYVNGYGVFEARKLLRHTRFRIVSYVNIRMVNSAPQKHPDAQKRKQQDERRKQAAVRKLWKFAARMESGKSTIGGIGPQLMGGIWVRAILRKPIRNNYRRMRVDMRACTQCMLCVRHCPVQCIRFDNGAFVFSEACEACMRCYHSCPAHAITNRKQ